MNQTPNSSHDEHHSSNLISNDALGIYIFFFIYFYKYYEVSSIFQEEKPTFFIIDEDHSSLMKKFENLPNLSTKFFQSPQFCINNTQITSIVQNQNLETNEEKPKKVNVSSKKDFCPKERKNSEMKSL